jgi:hypothetical protein
MVTFYAFIANTNILRIPSSVTETGTALDFLLHFKSQNHINKAQFDTKTLSVRLIVPEHELVSPFLVVIFYLHSLCHVDV